MHVFFFSNSTVSDLLDDLEESESAVERIYIAPPTTEEKSDEDSGEEDGGGEVGNVGGGILRAPGEAVLPGESDDSSSEDEDEVPQVRPRKKIAQKDALKYKWVPDAAHIPPLQPIGRMMMMMDDLQRRF